MTNKILIARIMRTLETSGGVGGGAELARQYAEAVGALNARLEATQTALDAGQTSDAVRLMEEEPKLVDEIGVLDFHQREPWRVLCIANGWPAANPIDSAIVDRVLEVSSSTAMREPALKAYRKAMRLRDDRAIVRALRSLTKLEPANAEWARDLARAEAAVQKALAADFKAAADDDRREEVASALLDEGWSVPPASALVAEAAAWRVRRDEERRAREQAEDMELLHACADGIWSRQRAEALLSHLDTLAGQGTPVPPAEVAFVEALRSRCEDEACAEAAAARWKELMEALHTAVEHANPDEIRRVMAEPEFLERPPDEDLLLAARRVIADAEEERRRKTRRIVGLAVLVLLAIAGGTAKLYMDRQFRAECAAEAANLERIAKAPRAHEALEKELARIKEEKPKVYADPEVVAYEARLVAIRKDHEARIGRVEDAISRLEGEREGGWEGDLKLFEDQFAKARDDILPEDEELSKRLAAVELDFTRVKGERRETALAKAREELGPLEEQAKSLADTLGSHFFDDAIAKNLDDFRDKVALWRTSHAEVAVAEAAQLDAAVAALDTPEKRSGEAAAALARLNGSAESGATAIIDARETLRNHYAGYQGVAALPALPVTKDDIETMLGGTLPTQTRFTGRGRKRLSMEEFAKFLDEEVLVLQKLPKVTSLYGLGSAGDGHEFKGISIGQVEKTTETSNAKGGTITRFRGEIYHVEKHKMDDELVAPGTQVLLPPCSELRDVMDAARAPSAEPGAFAALLWRLVEKHVRESHATREEYARGVNTKLIKVSYLDDETKPKRPLTNGRFPAYMRVRMLSLYLGWLERLGELPENLPANFVRLRRDCDRLASDVTVDGVEEALSWVCLDDDRVYRKNGDCAKFLAKELPDTFVKDLRGAADGHAQLGQFAAWRAECAGVFAFAPGDPSKCTPKLRPGTVNKPLYVLRKDAKGNPILRKMLVTENLADGKKRWAIVPGRGREWIPGEPLFQILDGAGKPIDAGATAKQLLSALPPAIQAEFKSAPFWIELDP